jgi:glycolate dehydrogenase FAD-binding subunit
VSSIGASLTRLASRMQTDIPGLPPADLSAAPASPADLAALLAEASAGGLRVLVWGGGSHQGLGHRVEPDLVVSTSRLNRVVAWEPDDMTVVVEGGVPVTELEALLATRGQTAVLPETSGAATVGGVLAAAISGYRRARYGPTRDRILEVTLVTGDGRIVKAGGRVVKNVTGYDLPRLVVGSLGSLGVIVSACLKLWPLPAVTATITLDEPGDAGSVYRPLAVLSDLDHTRVFVGGTDAEVESQAGRLAGSRDEGLAWPPALPGETTWSLRVPPALVDSALDKLPAGADRIVQVIVGEIALAADDLAAMADLRAWAESIGGRLVLTKASESVYERIDPWGAPPASLGVQLRLMEGFDPQRVLNPGRLPGRI